MPTYDVDETFLRDLRKLTPEQRKLFKTAVDKFEVGLRLIVPLRLRSGHLANAFRPLHKRREAFRKG